VLMPHTLEFVNNPHQVLREVEKIIRPEGHLIILGFNPISLYGVRRFFSNEGIWAGQFRSVNKVKDWLSLLGFKVVKSNYHKFLPSLQKDHELIEDLGKKICPIFAGMYIIIAKKTMLSLTPQKPEWKRAPKLIKKGFAKPASREICRD
jgi:2-polyprenyl-3-methyl-5-hydroxy-6-metoxy-1,4-benzoquinol methylase